MGKGNRNRLERAEDKLANPQKYVKKKASKVPAFIGPMVFAIVVVLLAVVIVGNSLVGAGVFMRARTAAETDDFSVDGAMMTYYINASYSNYVNYFYEMYSSILSSSSSNTNFNIYNYIGIDPNVSLKKQVYNEESGQTWFEYFAELATAQVEEQLVYAQAAKAAGVSLDDEDYAQIEENMKTLKSYADQYGVSLKNYIEMSYGTGVREKDIRKVMELEVLASKYAQMVNDDLYEASTDEKVNAFYEENQLDYLTADYLAYKLVAQKNEDAEGADELYAQDKQAIAQAADKLLTMTTEEEYKEYIKSYFAADVLDEYMSKYYSDYLAEAQGETDEEKAAAAEQKVKDKIAEDAAKEVEDILIENYAYAEDAELSDWVFGKDGGAAAAVNTAYKIADDSKDAEGTYSITVYFLVREASRDEDTTRTFTYLLLEDDVYPLSSAEYALELFEASERTSEALLTVGEEFANKGACQQLENVARGNTGVDEVDEWLFADERKAGDYTLLTYTYEDEENDEEVVFHILALLDEVGPAEWYLACEDAMVSEEMSDWYDEASKTYVVTIHESVVNGVKL